MSLQSLVNLTVYHIHPPGYPAAPINANTADLRGYIFFDVSSTLLLGLCHRRPDTPWCRNREITDPHLLITELTLEVALPFGPYGHCNICVNGTVPEQTLPTPCKDGEYLCDCSKHGEPYQPCGREVGQSDVAERHFMNCTNPFTCIYTKGSQKIGGLWYSTTAEGQCPGSGRGCTWRFVEVVQRIEKACAQRIVWTELEKRETACFAQCDVQGPASECWQYCFLTSTIGIGPDGKPVPHTVPIGPGRRHSQLLPLEAVCFTRVSLLR
eukprot:EG_transcript_23287